MKLITSGKKTTWERRNGMASKYVNHASLKGSPGCRENPEKIKMIFLLKIRKMLAKHIKDKAIENKIETLVWDVAVASYEQGLRENKSK